jgi:membrane associated rhomboid family serine protease
MDGGDQGPQGLPWPGPAPGQGGPGGGAQPGWGGPQPGWGPPQPVWGPPPGWGQPPPAPPVPGTPGRPHGGPPDDDRIGLGPNTRCEYHPDRLASSVCRSCNRPICSDCMVQAPVGWHCRQCVKREAKKSPVVRYRPGTPGAVSLSRVPVTMGLIIVCVALYVASSADPNLLNDYAEWGIGIETGQWYRLFTSIFFHLDFLHIALNMISLLVIGRLVEPLLGKWRYLALFLVTGFGGAVASYLLTNPLTPSVGASGAIFGLFGAYFVIARRAAADTSGILVLIVINLVYSFAVPGISWQDHLGGLATGLVVAAGFGLARGRRRQLEILADVVVLTAVCVALVLLMLLPAGVANLG